MGVYARATSQDTQERHRGGQGGVPGLVALGLLERWSVLSEDRRTRFSRRKDELGALLSREEGKTLAEGIGEVTRAGQIFEFFAGEALRLSGESVPSVRPGVGVEMTREADRAWSASSRRGTFRSPSRPGRSRRRSAFGNTVVIKPADLVPASCAWAIVEIAQPQRPAQGRAQPDHGPRLGGGPDHAREPGCRRHDLHRLGRTPAASASPRPASR